MSTRLGAMNDDADAAHNDDADVDDCERGASDCGGECASTLIKPGGRALSKNTIYIAMQAPSVRLFFCCCRCCRCCWLMPDDNDDEYRIVCACAALC